MDFASFCAGVSAGQRMKGLAHPARSAPPPGFPPLALECFPLSIVSATVPEMESVPSGAAYDEASFLSGLAAGRALRGWAVEPRNQSPQTGGSHILYAVRLDSAGTVRLHFGVYSYRTTSVLVNWGDGSAPETLQTINPPSGRLQARHEYAKDGFYVISLASDNPLWPVHDGALYSGVYVQRGISQSAALLEAAYFSGIVPQIGEYAFRASNHLAHATIPAEMERIGTSAFYSGFSLRSLTLPAALQNVGESAFYNCSALSDVYFTGSAGQWNAIAIADGNNPLTRAAVHYNSTGYDTI